MREEQEPTKPAGVKPSSADDAVAASDNDRVEEASRESFPASDAPAWAPLRSGPPRTDDDVKK